MSYPGNDFASGNHNNRRDNNYSLYKDPEFYIFLIITIGVLVGGFFLLHKLLEVYKARYPPFTFQVDFLEVTSMTFSRPNNSITSNQYFNLTVNTKDPLLFKPIQVTVEYDHQLVSSATIAPFRQETLSINTIPVLMGTAETRLPDKVIDSISTKLASEGVLDLTVIFRGHNWGVNPQSTDGYNCDMKMVCKGVAVTFSSRNNTWNGSTKDGPFLCRYSSSDCVW